MSWARLKQATRETININGKDQKTEVPSDVSSLMLKGEALEKLYKNVVEKSVEYFPERKLKAKNADDPVKQQPIHHLSNAFDSLAAEYQNSPTAYQFFIASSCTMANLARLKADLDAKAQEEFIEPKRSLVHTRVKEANKRYDTLKTRRLELDAAKHKLKHERKSDANGPKLQKYELDVQASQAKFDAEADNIRQLLGPLGDDEDMAQGQCKQAAFLLRSMKDYFYRSYQALDELDKAVNLESLETTGASNSDARLSHLAHSARPASPSSIHSRQHVTTPQSPRAAYSPSQFAPSAPSAPPIVTPKPTMFPVGSVATPFATANASIGAKPVLPKPRVSTKPIALPKCRALYDFEAEQGNDLTLAQGDVIEITKQEGEWWQGRNLTTNKTGQFPHNYVQLL